MVYYTRKDVDRAGWYVVRRADCEDAYLLNFPHESIFDYDHVIYYIAMADDVQFQFRGPIEKSELGTLQVFGMPELVEVSEDSDIIDYGYAHVWMVVTKTYEPQETQASEEKGQAQQRVPESGPPDETASG